MQGSETKEKTPGRAGKMLAQRWMRRWCLLAVFTALVIGGIIIWLAGGNGKAIQAYIGLFRGLLVPLKR